MNVAEAARALGMKPREISEVLDSPVGWVVKTIDGVSLIIVPDDRPDGAGRTGLMFLAAPSDGVYALPTYTMPEDDEPVVEEHVTEPVVEVVEERVTEPAPAPKGKASK